MKDDDLGPLPKADRKDELEELSFQAFASAFAVDRFRVRSEPGKDRGVDRYLELKFAGHDTNLRAQVQLKSAESPSVNADGSVSKSVKVTNLNYLLNGPCPMYVLYIESTGMLYFAWARDEVSAFDRENRDWMGGESVTIRFSKLLNDSAFEEIETRIAHEARLSRRLHQRLTQASRSESPRFEIGIDGKITDSEAAKNAIETSGITFVASGYPQRVVELLGLLTTEQLRQKRTQLVHAYAQLILGRFDLAMGSLRECGAIAGELAPADQWLYDEIENSCEYRRGRRPQEDYQRRVEEIAKIRGGAFEAYAQVEKLRFQFIRTEKGPLRDKVMLDLEKAVEHVKNGAGASPILTISSEVMLLYSKGHEIVSAVLEKIGIQVIRSNSGIPRASEEELGLEELCQSWSDWLVSAEGLIDRSAQAKHPILYADAQYTRASVVALSLLNLLTASEIGWISLSPDFGAQCTAAIADAEAAIAVYKSANCLESELRARLALADLFEIGGRQAEAREIASEIHSVCVAMGYTDLAQRASDIRSGDSHLNRLRNQLGEVNQGSSGELMTINMTDDDVRTAAKTMVRAWGIPESRTDNVFHDLTSRRRIATEKRDWCQHIELQQHLGHMTSVDTMYASALGYRCMCTLLDLHLDRNSDWSGLIDSFKGDNCASCPQRSPGTA